MAYGWKNIRVVGIVFVLIAMLVFFSLPTPNSLFDVPYSMVVESREGHLLEARVSSDGQWRFPPGEEIPELMTQLLILSEDKRFYYHPGIDPAAIVRATYQNIKTGRTISGASTLSMQLARMGMNNRNRTFSNKFREMLMALKIELLWSKEKILNQYLTHAPFGGNVVGLESAAWRYFSRPTQNLSISEYAMLAVLPQNPSRIHPGGNREGLKASRNSLLKKAFETGIVSETMYELSITEPLPPGTTPLPSYSFHLAESIAANTFGRVEGRIRTSIDFELQREMVQIALDHQKLNRGNLIHNLAAIVIDIENSEVLGYIGNSPEKTNKPGQSVDIIQRPRSTGSILKPFLFAVAHERGIINQKTLLEDIPFFIGDFSPSNFSGNFDGLVSAEDALMRSLNIPFVKLLQEFGVYEFYQNLKSLGLNHITEPADHYGLTLITGGAEASLWELSRAYMHFIRPLFKSNSTNGAIENLQIIYGLKGEMEYPIQSMSTHEGAIAGAGPVFLTLETLTQNVRPDEGGGYHRFSTTYPIAWKTGTSHGFRDAWSIGIGGGKLVGVWVGNATGEGRPGLTGATAAAPLMFDIFDQLLPEKKISAPLDDLEYHTICKTSGLNPSKFCPTEEIITARNQSALKTCFYHKRIKVTIDGKYRLKGECGPDHKFYETIEFRPDPGISHFIDSRSSLWYRHLPLHPECKSAESAIRPFDLIYPVDVHQLYITRSSSGDQNPVVLMAHHFDPHKTIHWHINNYWIQSTVGHHEFSWNPIPGENQLLLMDEDGHRLLKKMTVFSR